MRKNDDLISRQDALSFLRNWERVKDYSWGERNIIKATINEIESLPSAQSETHEERTETHACDLISRQDFDKFLKDAEKEAAKYRKYVFASALNTIRGNLRNFPSTQPKSEERKTESAQNVPIEDLISRKAAIDAVEHITSSMSICVNTDECHGMKRMQRQAVIELANLPSAQPEPCEDAVSREAAIDAALSAFSRGLLASPDIRKLPSVQPERKKGKWIDAVLPNDSGGLQVQVCNQCNTFFPLAYTGGGHNFCPHCGADMREDTDDQSK